MCRYLPVHSSTVQAEYSRDMLHKHTNNLSGTVLSCTKYTPTFYKQNTLGIYIKTVSYCTAQMCYVTCHIQNGDEDISKYFYLYKI